MHHLKQQSPSGAGSTTQKGVVSENPDAAAVQVGVSTPIVTHQHCCDAAHEPLDLQTIRFIAALVDAVEARTPKGRSMTRRVKVTGDRFHPHVPEGAVYVGRQAPYLRRSPHANPYTVEKYGLDECLRLYRLHAERFDLEALRRDLMGHDLACWCPVGQPCHADVLLKLANP